MSKFDYRLPPDLVIGEAMDAVPAETPWHMKQLESIRGIVDGAGVKIAVLDTGYSKHPLMPTPIAERSFIGGQSVNDPQSGHGTWCCGCTSAREHVGVAPASELIVGKVLSNQGSGSSQGIAQGIVWAADQGADVISLSLGGGAYTPTREAIEYARDKYGTITLAAAGNAGFNGRNTIGYPAGFMPDPCCVASHQENGQISGFSSGGRQVDLAAPGSNTLSLNNRGSGFRFMSGTSMATPFAAGVFALVIQLMRRRGHARLRGMDAWRDFLDQFMDDRGAPGEDDRFGAGVPKVSMIIDAIANDGIAFV